MSLLRIREVMPVEGVRLRLTLTDGSIVERDIIDLLTAPIFEPLRKDALAFRQVKVESGTVVWPNGADLCPDDLGWDPAKKLRRSSPVPDPEISHSRSLNLSLSLSDRLRPPTFFPPGGMLSCHESRILRATQPSDTTIR